MISGCIYIKNFICISRKYCQLRITWTNLHEPSRNSPIIKQWLFISFQFRSFELSTVIPQISPLSPAWQDYFRQPF